MTDIQPIDDERVSAYLDGELTDEERGEFEALLRQREDYALIVEQLQTMRTAIKALPRHKLPGDFAEGVLRRAEREMLIGTNATQATTSQAAGQRSLWILAAVLAACLLAMIAWPRFRELDQPLVAQTEKEGSTTENRELAEDLGRRAPLAGTAGGRAGTDLEEALAASPKSRSREARGAAPATAVPEPPLSGRPIDRDPTATAESAVTVSTDDGRELADAERQLADQAQALKQKAESAAQQWDVVVATQLRAPEDWQQLNLALAANRFELLTESAPSLNAVLTPASNSNDGEALIPDFDADLFNQQLLRKLDSSRLTLGEAAAEKRAPRGQAPPATPEDTYLLYVEGTAEQLAGLVRQLPGADTAKLVNIKAPLSAIAAWTREVEPEARKSARADALQRESAEDSRDMKPITPGRVANLGLSTLDDALSPTFRDRAAKVSLSWQQAYGTPAPDTVDGPDPGRLRGLILLQDVGGTLSSKIKAAPHRPARPKNSEPTDAPQDDD